MTDGAVMGYNVIGPMLASTTHPNTLLLQVNRLVAEAEKQLKANPHGMTWNELFGAQMDENIRSELQKRLQGPQFRIVTEEDEWEKEVDVNTEEDEREKEADVYFFQWAADHVTNADELLQYLSTEEMCYGITHDELINIHAHAESWIKELVTDGRIIHCTSNDLSKRNVNFSTYHPRYAQQSVSSTLLKAWNEIKSPNTIQKLEEELTKQGLLSYEEIKPDATRSHAQSCSTSSSSSTVQRKRKSNHKSTNTHLPQYLNRNSHT